MRKVESDFIKEHFLSKSLTHSRAARERELQEHGFTFPLLPFSNQRTLKAVYPYFSEAKRKMHEVKQFVPYEFLSSEELKQAMEEAKSSYEDMHEVQEKLNKAYQELMGFNSNFM